MAIYHLNAKVISRGKGKSATAAAAYRAAEKIYDERTGLTFDYTRKFGVYATEIIAPNTAPDWVKEREKLWNEVELVETRSNSRVAREFDIALPVELDHTQKQELVRGFVREELVNLGLVADVAYHDIDTHNPHAHILLTTRKVDRQGFTTKERQCDLKTFLLGLRESWSEHTNRALERAGTSERIDHRSLSEQNINRIPQIHLGANVAAMMDKGIATERSDRYLGIIAANQEIQELERVLAATEEEIASAGKEKESLRDSPVREGERGEKFVPSSGTAPQNKGASPLSPASAQDAAPEDLASAQSPAPKIASNRKYPPIPYPVSAQSPVPSDPSPPEPPATKKSRARDFSTDIPIITSLRAIEQWEKTKPREPLLGVDEEFNEQLRRIRNSYGSMSNRLQREQESLFALEQAKPRSFFNPRGLTESEIRYKKQVTTRSIAETKLEIERIQKEYKKAKNRLADWQKEVNAYQAWHSDPKTLAINELSRQLEEPSIKAHIEWLKSGYLTYANASYILERQGTATEDGSYFQGNFYRFEREGKKITITHKDREEPLYEAEDLRDEGGIIQISHFNLSEQEIEMAKNYAKALYEQHSKQQQEQERPSRSRGFSR
jgi:hypothetical protein